MLFKNSKKKGFSLVELIVVIAIMAVLTAILAPSLFGYVEKSRAQKDDSAMGEVTNAMQLALADQSVYDEALSISEENVPSCYVDTLATPSDDKKIIIKEMPSQFLFNDNTRKLDEVRYYANGQIKGFNLTFTPDIMNSKNAAYVLANAKINALEVGKSTLKEDTVTLGTLISDKQSYLYNKLKLIVGDAISLTSRTYRNSNYTIFVRVGTAGGKDVSAQDAIKIYGQWNGTNLDGVDNSSGTNQPINDNDEEEQEIVIDNENIVGNVVPEGCTYQQSGTTYTEGQAVPSEPQDGDIFKDTDYCYVYNKYYDTNYARWESNLAQNGWGVRVLKATKSSYSEIKSSINGKSITFMTGTFQNCPNLVSAPRIPKSVTDMRNTFNYCPNLTTAPAMPEGVTNMERTFTNCTNLTTAPVIPEGVTTMKHTFSRCVNLITAPVIPGSVVNMEYTFTDCTNLTTVPTISEDVTTIEGTFSGCENLTTVPTIPASVTNMWETFFDCKNLTGTIKINATPSSNYKCFYNTLKPITITGTCANKMTLSNTANNNNVTY